MNTFDFIVSIYDHVKDMETRAFRSPYEKGQRMLGLRTVEEPGKWSATLILNHAPFDWAAVATGSAEFRREVDKDIPSEVMHLSVEGSSVLLVEMRRRNMLKFRLKRGSWQQMFFLLDEPVEQHEMPVISPYAAFQHAQANKWATERQWT
jgi:hypothetical protein